MQRAWVEFLSGYSWTFFGTYTFVEVVHPERASKLWGYYVSRINRALYGSRWKRHGPGIAWVRALEMQRREVIHYHALLGGDDELRAQRLRDLVALWSELSGAFSKIERIDSYGAVVAYCCKYAAKGGEVDMGGDVGGAAWGSVFERLRNRLL